MSTPPLRQPKTIKCGTLRFRRVQEWRHVDGPISEGPFYVRVGVREDGVVYIPDLGYTHGRDLQCRMMHRIRTA